MLVPTADLAVDCFFWLSGFLATTHLLEFLQPEGGAAISSMRGPDASLQCYNGRELAIASGPWAQGKHVDEGGAGLDDAHRG